MTRAYIIPETYPYQLQALVRCIDYSNGFEDRLLTAADIDKAYIRYYRYNKDTGEKIQIGTYTTDCPANTILGDVICTNTIPIGVAGIVGEGLNVNFLYTDNKPLTEGSYYVKVVWNPISTDIVPYDTEWYIDVIDERNLKAYIQYEGYLNFYADLYISDPNLLIGATAAVETNRRLTAGDIQQVILNITKDTLPVAGFTNLDITADYQITPPVTETIRLSNGRALTRTFNVKYTLSRRRDSSTTPPTVYDPFQAGDGVYKVEFTITPTIQSHIDPLIYNVEIRR